MDRVWIVILDHCQVHLGIWNHHDYHWLAAVVVVVHYHNQQIFNYHQLVCTINMFCFLVLDQLCQRKLERGFSIFFYKNDISKFYREDIVWIVYREFDQAIFWTCFWKVISCNVFSLLSARMNKWWVIKIYSAKKWLLLYYLLCESYM